jgi:hypothetical protein
VEIDGEPFNQQQAEEKGGNDMAANTATLTR